MEREAMIPMADRGGLGMQHPMISTSFAQVDNRIRELAYTRVLGVVYKD
jgi:hypothetical protein